MRIAESLAKMSLLPFALESHVDEALRLFKVSTLDAANSGSLSGQFIEILIIFSTDKITLVWKMADVHTVMPSCKFLSRPSAS